jgi:hemolysin type calcium-binding protein
VIFACQSGADHEFGDVGDDRLLGGAGDDVLSGGRGIDDLQGGAGDDRINAVDPSATGRRRVSHIDRNIRKWTRELRRPDLNRTQLLIQWKCAR